MLNSLKDPTRCRNHSRATKIGQRMWKRKALCSNGVPCRSRIRNLIRPRSESSSSSLRRPKLTRALLATERSSAIASSSRTKPWSRTRMASSGITRSSTVAMGRTSVESAHVGTSGWAYPSWKPGFYPAGTDSSEFLRYYAGLFDTVELNTTGYRLPSEEQFKRWADAVPEGFTFAPKLPGNRPRIVSEFAARARHLGEHLGPVRGPLTSPRDDGMLQLLLGSLDPDLRLAFDLQDESWDGV